MTEAPIVIVDDEASLRATISFMLEMEGFTVAVAEDGESGLDMVRRLRPPVVLLDAMMPRLDGFEVCRRIKSEGGTDGTVVVMLTALGQRSDRERAVAAGADHFITKPFDEDELLALLRGILGNQGSE